MIRNRSDFKKDLFEIINLYNKYENDYEGVLICGSNYNIDNFNDIPLIESDIDIIVLTRRSPFNTFVKHKQLFLDFTFINYFDIANLLYDALIVKGASGKVFNALGNNYSYIGTTKSNNDVRIFLEVIKKLYHIFDETSIPDNTKNTSNLRSVFSNLRKKTKRDEIEAFFGKKRFDLLVFDYVVKLIYPFTAVSSFKGRVLSRVVKQSSFNNNSVYDLKQRYAPITNHNYKAIIYDQLIIDKLKANEFSSFFFGYDNLIFEKRILFIKEEEFFLKQKELKDGFINLNNIIPCLNKEEFELYINFIIYLSKKSFLENLEKRLGILGVIYKKISLFGFKQIIDKTLRAVLIKKTILEFKQKGKELNPIKFNLWLTKLDSSLVFDSCENILSESYEKELFNILSSENYEEKKIKVSHVFFGIMKALQLDIIDLNFKKLTKMKI